MDPLGLDVGGYVLAGGRSSRMGRDKALLELGGKPLALHAVTKLQRVCSDVHILSGNMELAAYAPLVQDLHPGCGPIGGIEAALAHSYDEWNLFLPVDMPFFPSAFLSAWVGANVASWGMHGRAVGIVYCVWNAAAVVLPVAPGRCSACSFGGRAWRVQGLSGA